MCHDRLRTTISPERWKWTVCVPLLFRMVVQIICNADCIVLFCFGCDGSYKYNILHKIMYWLKLVNILLHKGNNIMRKVCIFLGMHCIQVRQSTSLLVFNCWYMVCWIQYSLQLSWKSNFLWSLRYLLACDWWLTHNWWKVARNKNQLWQLKRFSISSFTMDLWSYVRTWFSFINDKCVNYMALKHS